MLYKGYRKIKVPAPWASGRVIETIHPVRDNYKFKETVSFPGAKHLYLKFDPRCSSQYDYDKVWCTCTCTVCTSYTRCSSQYVHVHDKV